MLVAKGLSRYQMIASQTKALDQGLPECNIRHSEEWLYKILALVKPVVTQYFEALHTLVAGKCESRTAAKASSLEVSKRGRMHWQIGFKKRETDGVWKTVRAHPGSSNSGRLC